MKDGKMYMKFRDHIPIHIGNKIQTWDIGCSIPGVVIYLSKKYWNSTDYKRNLI